MNNFKKNDLKKTISTQILFPLIINELKQDRKAVITLSGNSMWPFLCHARDQVILENYDHGNLIIGDIILFKTEDGNYILHRITNLSAGRFQTTGDGNFYRDGWFPNDCIIAKVSAFYRKGKIIDCSNHKYKLLSYIWIVLFPVRKSLFSVWFKIRNYVKSA